MKSLIYGYGETGKSFERYLIKKKLKYDIFDINIPELNKKYKLKSYDQILCSPGIPKEIFEDLKNANKNVLTDIDIFFKEDNSIKIGITGTNRKSTTAYHLHQLFNINSSSNLIGNIGNTMLDNINNNRDYSVIELSSFQLDKMKKNNLDYGILLNIDIDHLDYHGDFELYKLAKEKILQAKKSISFEMDPYILFKWITKSKAKEIKLKNLPYRFEFISNRIINDSKSTNSYALFYALRKANKIFDSDYILIVCGDPKKEKFREIFIDGPKEILIFGQHLNELNKCIKNSNKHSFQTLQELLIFIQNKNKNKNKLQNILFSPGYPSGKDYKNFVERGEAFDSFAKNI